MRHRNPEAEEARRDRDDAQNSCKCLLLALTVSTTACVMYHLECMTPLFLWIGIPALFIFLFTGATYAIQPVLREEKEKRERDREAAGYRNYSTKGIDP